MAELRVHANTDIWRSVPTSAELDAWLPEATTGLDDAEAARVAAMAELAALSRAQPSDLALLMREPQTGLLAFAIIAVFADVGVPADAGAAIALIAGDEALVWEPSVHDITVGAHRGFRISFTEPLDDEPRDEHEATALDLVRTIFVLDVGGVLGIASLSPAPVDAAGFALAFFEPVLATLEIVEGA